jgi:hypothetical protein
MQHTRIKILVLMTIFLTSGRCFSQNQQVLRNGYVAATNQGIYYLQDGTDEWLNFNIDGKWVNVFFYRDLDTITSLTYNGRDLFCTGYALDYTGIYLDVSNIKINGNNNYENYGDPTRRDNHPYQFRPIFGTNKFKTKNIQYIAKPTWVYDYNCALRNNNDGYIATSHSELSTEITGICSDNDSIVVVVGPNNKLAKITCTNNFTSMTVSWVTGLVSEATNKHKVCYDQIRDLFYIISCDDVYRDFNIYSYNKSTITQITNGITVADTIFNLISGEGIFNDDMYAIGKDTYSSDIRILFFNKVTGASNSGRIIWMGENDVFHGDLVFNRQANEIGFGAKNLFKILDTNGLTVKTINLPSGVIIYDLEYINYLE